MAGASTARLWAVPAPLTLIRLDGPEDPLVGARASLTGQTVVGRAAGSDLCLPDASVSRRHASLREIDGRWWLTDQRSTSGTILNGRRLEPNTPAPLEPGDRIAIGPWLFRVEGERTGTRTVAVTIDEPTASALPTSTRRLDALSACLDEFEHAASPHELAAAALRAAMDGTGFGRGAVLLPPDGAEPDPVLVAGLARVEGGLIPLDPADFAPSGSLIGTALSGRTAVLTERGVGGTIEPTRSIAEQTIHSAVCAPVTHDGRVAALIYLDARRGETPVPDAGGYCEDIARLYAFALTRDARADLARRQVSMRAELERAREMRAMLAPPPVGRAGAFRHASRTIAGLFVSADLFDAIGHADGSATVLFGDASGHGVGAAMLAALVQSHLAGALAAGLGLEAAVAQTNRFVALRPTGGRFVSLVGATLTPDGQVRLVDAGHGHWLIVRASAGAEHAGRATSAPLGVDPDQPFRVTEHRLRPGDRLVCYTDGIPDQADGSGERFGLGRLTSALGGSDGLEADVSTVFDALLRHAAGRALDDDATVASIGLG